MITPRRTRLVRVPDLPAFRQALALLCPDEDAVRARSRLVIVPSRGAARLAGKNVGQREHPTRFVTREELYDALHDRLPEPPTRLDAYARDALMQAAGRDSSPSVRLRPGLVAEMLRFYDQLRRQGRNVARFEELLDEALSRDAEFDRGAERMLAQGRILAAAFHGYESRVAAARACDEHALRARLIAEASRDPIRDIIVSVGDWIAEPGGLFLADFDLLTRLPGLETVDLVATEELLASGFHERVHEWLPGIEEVPAAALGVPATSRRPLLLVPSPPPDPAADPGSGPAAAGCFVVRDREEELVAVARRLAPNRGVGAALSRSAVVYKRPLPYLYLAREVFGGARIPFQTSDTLPLAAEPFAGALDLVVDFVESEFTRSSLVALLLSPHFAFEEDGTRIGRDAVGALDRALAEARYLGGVDRLREIVARRSPDAAGSSKAAESQVGQALRIGVRLAERLSPLATSLPVSVHARTILSFLDDYAAPVAANDPLAVRLRRAREAVLQTLFSLEQAHAAYNDAPVDVGQLAVMIRRWIEDQTFAEAAGSSGNGVHLVDDQAARYGDFDEVTVVGVIENEWPERPVRNIFYPAALLTRLGWPSERDRRRAGRARFLDLLASAARSVAVSTVTLDDEALVEPSVLVDDIARAGLSTSPLHTQETPRVFVEEALSLEPVDLPLLDSMLAVEGGASTREWAAMRLARSSVGDPAFHGRVPGPSVPRAGGPWSVSALETYLDCPFKFFARYVLRLKEQPEDEEVMDPRTEGALVHRVFETFFGRWQAHGHQGITIANIDEARALFVEIADESLAHLSDTEAALARTRLLGSPAAAGLGEAVLRMEAERPVPVLGRRLEYELKGDFSFTAADGERTIPLRGKADRVDLLADGTFRLIDYKLGWPPNKARALQLPIYGLCAEQQLDGELGRRWILGEAAYLAFKGPRRVVPLVSSRDDRAAVLAGAQQRLVDVVDAIARGDFPPRPDDVHRCETCSYAAVCRKDYVGDI